MTSFFASKKKAPMDHNASRPRMTNQNFLLNQNLSWLVFVLSVQNKYNYKSIIHSLLAQYLII